MKATTTPGRALTMALILSMCFSVSAMPQAALEIADQRLGQLLDTQRERVAARRFRRNQISLGCKELQNHGTHFTVEIEVGTPPQIFDTVADTGSNSVIVPSCVCMDMGRCSTKDRCFRGTNRSQTFAILASLPQVVMSFGSGQIEAAIATDVVRVGKVEATMPNALLLMVDRALDIDGAFEGILGLGLPPSKDAGLTGKPRMPTASPGAPSMPGRHEVADRRVQRAGMVPPEEEIEMVGFLEAAKIDRFSMCFNEGKSGFLRLGTDRVPGALGSVGKVHWGLDFRGVSVGGAEGTGQLLDVGICSPGSMAEGQLTPCGAIPDSGTTAIMAPQAHIVALLESICDRWERCSNMTRETEGATRIQVLSFLLSICEDWMTPERGLSELPSLHFAVAGSDGTTQTLEMPAASYIIQSLAEEVHHVTKKLMGVVSVELLEPTGRTHMVCAPAFGTMEYPTALNGPVWIFGTPFFYEFVVGYDLGSDPPSIGFTRSQCDCDGRASLVEDARFTRRERSWTPPRKPRTLRGPMRWPNIDVSKPL